MHILQLKNITKSFTTNGTSAEVLNNCKAQFQQGSIYGLIGSSGIGKSTLMHIIAGIDTPTSGEVFFDDQPLQSMTSQKRAKLIGFVTQTPLMIKELTVYQNCILAGQIAKVDTAQLEKFLQELLMMLGLTHTSHWNVGQLSRGQLQRIALIRAIIMQPQFLCADEPTGNLDEVTGIQVLETLLICQKKWGMGLIISSHNSYITQKCEHLLTIKNGELITLR